MTEDEVVVLAALSIALTVIVTPAALIVGLVCRELRRSRAADGRDPSPRGFYVIEGKQPARQRGHPSEATCGDSIQLET